MVTSYTWHPGTGSLNPHWAVHVPLLPDEIISSWLVRAALTQGCDPMVLTGGVWPKWRVWTLDADRAMPEDRLKPLSLLSGISLEAFKSATLHQVASRIHGGQPPEKAAWPWILTLGTRNTKRRSGLQYCPICLSEDTKPYYRLQWRFAWHTACERHGCGLLDRCWNCEAPVEPHRLKAEDLHVAICATCKADLREAKAGACPSDAFALQQEADRVLQEHQGACLGKLLSDTLWFEMADFFVSLFRRANRSGTEGLTSLMRDMGTALPQSMPSIAGASIELLRVHDRQQILGAAWHFLSADRGRIENALKDFSVTRQGFCGKSEPVHILVAELAETLPDRPVTRARQPKPRLAGPRPHREVMRMVAKLERKLEMMRR